jgi:hypothetical protein
MANKPMIPEEKEIPDQKTREDGRRIIRGAAKWTTGLAALVTTLGLGHGMTNLGRGVFHAIRGHSSPNNDDDYTERDKAFEDALFDFSVANDASKFLIIGMLGLLLTQAKKKQGAGIISGADNYKTLDRATRAAVTAFVLDAAAGSRVTEEGTGREVNIRTIPTLLSEIVGSVALDPDLRAQAIEQFGRGSGERNF